MAETRPLVSEKNLKRSGAIGFLLCGGTGAAVFVLSTTAGAVLILIAGLSLLIAILPAEAKPHDSTDS